MIELWDVALGPADQTVLSLDERERAARFRFERDRGRFIAGRSALRHILSRYANAHPAAIAFRYNRFGKPELAAATGVHFNASHSEGRMFLAVADRNVGVDLERVRPDLRFEAIAQRFFPPAEAELARSPEEFFRVWTRREAYVKAVGCGLSEIGAPMREGWWVEDLDAGSGWAAAVAAGGDRCPIVQRVFQA